MRDTLYVGGFLLAAIILLIVGRNELPATQLLAWGVSFGAAAAVVILVVSLFRVREELYKSRQELARKDAEIHFAREVQRELFPRRIPTDSGLEFSATCLPAQGISGDSYDILRLPDGRLVFSLADVSGKGISAAILMANLHAFLRILIETEQSLEAVCRRLNQHLFQVTEPAKFATLFLAEWTPETRQLRYVNAGHQVPILSGVEPECELNRGGPPIGLFPDMTFESGVLTLAPTNVMVVFSDGVTEAQTARGEEFGTDRLRSIIEDSAHLPPAGIESRIVEAVRNWSAGSLHDDVTVVAVRAESPSRRESSGVGEPVNALEEQTVE